MFYKLICTIVVSAILQVLIYIIAPQSTIKNMFLTCANIITSSIIFNEIILIISNFLYWQKSQKQ